MPDTAAHTDNNTSASSVTVEERAWNPHQETLPEPRRLTIQEPVPRSEALRRAGEWWTSIRERDLTEQIRRRIELRKWAEESEKRRTAALAACADDVVTFFDDWVWTYDPRNVDRGLPTDIPFVLRPRQRDFVRWLKALMELRRNGVVEKSRDEGMTYCVAGVFVHEWLFSDGFKAGIGSRKQEYVDELGNLDAIFPKIRQILQYLPDWMLPAGFEHGGPDDNFCRLKNPDNGSAITGEAGDEIGRGGRNTAYFVDEHASLPRPQLAERSLSQNTNCIIYGSTPKGPGNLFYEKRHSGDLPVFTFHWRENPHKNYEVAFETPGGNEKVIKPWYERQKDEYDSVTIAQEADIDYAASQEGAVIPGRWVQAAIAADLEPSTVNRSGLDVAEGGDDDTVYTNRQGGRVTRIETIAEENPGDAAETVEQKCREDGTDRLQYDRLGVGSGITATLVRKENDPDQQVPFEVIGVANSESPSGRTFEDQPDTPNDERFYNWAAEQWWALRLRFKRTYERLEQGEPHPVDECISIPNRSSLIAQLSQPTYSKTSTGKIKVHKKGGGTGSPDEAESCMYAFAEPVGSDHTEGIDWGSMQNDEIRV